jgi:hypothetical protein
MTALAGFVIGFLVGGVFGLIGMAILSMGKDEDHES